MNGSSQNHEIILEIRRIGNVFRVAAIDTVTLIIPSFIFK
jgi:hypothetical protein